MSVEYSMSGVYEVISADEKMSVKYRCRCGMSVVKYECNSHSYNQGTRARYSNLPKPEWNL